MTGSTSTSKPLLVVKVGTNVITNDDGFLDTATLGQIVSQVCGLKKEGVRVILVSSGAMAAGRALLTSQRKEESVINRQMLAAIGQTILMYHYIEESKKYDYLSAQVLTTREDFRTRQHYLNMQQCFSALLDDDVIPIVNENDVVSVEELMFTDNDELAGMIASMMDADALVFLTNVDGVCADEACTRVVPVVDPTSKEWKKYIQSVQSAFGKGGMHTKCTIACKLANNGIAVHIVNGRKEHVLDDILAGKHVGTHFQAAKRSSRVKRWVAHAEGSEKGKVIVNDGAADVLVSPTVASLLPVGVVGVEGEFDAGDIIQICREDGSSIGLGKAQYGAERARACMGEKGKKPLVHYDYLSIL